ncbi:hypothetical protein AAFC00_001688 [Neodothiora populina]|uniref:Uncharacterized protein n=1 Tax=Neodothiora populina TaxID=2781224 RepID=A0ABR3PPT6_9PEZI
MSSKATSFTTATIVSSAEDRSSREADMETLPSYSDATTGDPPPKSKSRFATLKSILTGDVYKHHPLYTLERSVMNEESSSSSRNRQSSR